MIQKEMSPEMLKVFKQKLVETMSAFIGFCAENNITYFATGGTAIGAIRHKGFIPWDDDIDVCMLRSEYDRFMALREKLKGTGFEITDYHSRGIPTPYAKFVNMNTTLVEFDYNPVSTGLFIDVFPFDNVGTNMAATIELKNRIITNMQRYQRTTFDLDCRSMMNYLKGMHLNTIFKAIKYKLIYKHQVEKYVQMLEEDDRALRSVVGECVLNYYTFYKVEKEIFPKAWFSDTVEKAFEDIVIKLPIGYHEYLSKLFGDYMTPPPVEKQISHHSHYYCNLKEHLTIDEVRKRLSKGERYVM